MEEIALQIHSEGHEPHEITAPPEIETGEFIRELVLGLRLPENVLWEADDKDTGHTLAAGKTLHQNGVRAGHHLYLKSRPLPASPEPPPRLIPPPEPTPQTSRWPLILAIALIPIVGAGAYLLGSRQDQQLRPALRDAQAVAADANQRASAAEAHAAQLQKQLDEFQQKAGGANAQVSQLSLQVSQLTQDADKKQKQIKLDQAKIAELSQNANDLRASAAKDQDQVKRLEASAQASAQQIASLQSDLAAARQQLQNVAQKGKDKQPPQLQPRPNYGWLIWSGDLPKGNVVEIKDNRAIVGSLSGRLPGVPCTIEAADPDNVNIDAVPDAGTAWTRVVFRVKNKNKAPVRLLWVVR